MLTRLANLHLSAPLFGGTCFLCRGDARELLCEACESDLTSAAAACPRCALPTPRGETCGACLARPPAYDCSIAAFIYAFPADALVHSLKFRGELAIAPFLARRIAARASIDAHAAGADLVVPVPLSARRLRERGYNQAAEIARPLAAALGGRLELDACRRPRETAAQAELPWSERSRNVRGAFECRVPLHGARVAVVDDVMTTGATLEELAKVLKEAGASRVVNWVAARTPPPA